MGKTNNPFSEESQRNGWSGRNRARLDEQGELEIVRDRRAFSIAPVHFGVCHVFAVVSTRRGFC